MTINRRIMIPLALALFAAGFFAGSSIELASEAQAQGMNRVFELRTYTAHPGRLAELHARFRDHTVGLFERHGMTNIGYFAPQEAPLADNTLIYLLAHDSREAAAASWDAFRSDPEWQQAAEASRRNGRLVANVDSVFLDPTGYSMMK